MLRDKVHGEIPFGAAGMSPAELAPHLIRLQGERTELNDELDKTRAARDAAAEVLRLAKIDAERRALATLPVAKGKDEPTASAVKDFVDGDTGVLAAKDRQSEIARDLATADDRLGAVRSGLRVLHDLIEIAHRPKAGSAGPSSGGEDW